MRGPSPASASGRAGIGMEGVEEEGERGRVTSLSKDVD